MTSELNRDAGRFVLYEAIDRFDRVRVAAPPKRIFVGNRHGIKNCKHRVVIPAGVSG